MALPAARFAPARRGREWPTVRGAVGSVPVGQVCRWQQRGRQQVQHRGRRCGKSVSAPACCHAGGRVTHGVVSCVLHSGCFRGVPDALRARFSTPTAHRPSMSDKRAKGLDGLCGAGFAATAARGAAPGPVSGHDPLQRCNAIQGRPTENGGATIGDMSRPAIGCDVDGGCASRTGRSFGFRPTHDRAPETSRLHSCNRPPYAELGTLPPGAPRRAPAKVRFIWRAGLATRC